MMTNNHRFMNPTRITFATAAAALAFLAPALASATDKSDYCRSQAGYASGVTLAKGTAAQMISYGDCQIGFRDTDLNAALTRVGEMQRVSDATRQSLTSSINATLASLATIKSALDSNSGTSATSTVYAQVRTIFTSVRVYQLRLPVTWSVAAADRELTTAALLAQVQAELQAALDSAPSIGQTTPLQVYLNDMSAKLADANAQATSAENGVVNLAPDNGDATVRANNKAALATALTQVEAGRTDLKAARQDAQIVAQALDNGQ
jgi:hypothetical protein